jgi:hypothetical protein
MKQHSQMMAGVKQIEDLGETILVLRKLKKKFATRETLMHTPQQTRNSPPLKTPS